MVERSPIRTVVRWGRLGSGSCQPTRRTPVAAPADKRHFVVLADVRASISSQRSCSSPRTSRDSAPRNSRRFDLRPSHFRVVAHEREFNSSYTQIRSTADAASEDAVIPRRSSDVTSADTGNFGGEGTTVDLAWSHRAESGAAPAQEPVLVRRTEHQFQQVFFVPLMYAMPRGGWLTVLLRSGEVAPSPACGYWVCLFAGMRASTILLTTLRGVDAGLVHPAWTRGAMSSTRIGLGTRFTMTLPVLVRPGGLL